MNAAEHAHHRLYDAVITYIGADLHGSKAEIRASVIELHAARDESESVLFSASSAIALSATALTFKEKIAALNAVMKASSSITKKVGMTYKMNLRGTEEEKKNVRNRMIELNFIEADTHEEG
jgi:hypothetical protein